MAATEATTAADVIGEGTTTSAPLVNPTTGGPVTNMQGGETTMADEQPQTPSTSSAMKQSGTISCMYTEM